MRKLIVLSLALILIFDSCAYELLFYHNDNRGSPVMISKKDSLIEWASAYQPFGDILNEQGKGDLKYNGKELDESGSYYFGARFYDSSSGRFLTPDSIKTFPSPYTYGSNNPMTRIDPSGNEDFNAAKSSSTSVDYIGIQLKAREARREAIIDSGDENLMIQNGIPIPGLGTPFFSPLDIVPGPIEVTFGFGIQKGISYLAPKISGAIANRLNARSIQHIEKYLRSYGAVEVADDLATLAREGKIGIFGRNAWKTNPYLALDKYHGYYVYTGILGPNKKLIGILDEEVGIVLKRRFGYNPKSEIVNAADTAIHELWGHRNSYFTIPGFAGDEFQDEMAGYIAACYKLDHRMPLNIDDANNLARISFK